MLQDQCFASLHRLLTILDSYSSLIIHPSPSVSPLAFSPPQITTLFPSFNTSHPYGPR